MTARNYDTILTVADATNFVPGNSVVGSTSATVGLIANVNIVTKELKVKLNNVLQEFHNSETITSTSSVVGGSILNKQVFTPIVTINNIGAADSSRSAGTYAIAASDWSGSGSGQDATFSIVVNGSGAAAITITAGGTKFIVGETITVADSKLGSGGGAALTFKIGRAHV